MTNQKNTPEKVAGVLEGSGLWKNGYGCSEMAEDRCTHLFAVGNCIGCNAYRAGLFRGRLTADQAEEILGKMGLAVVWSEKRQEWGLVWNLSPMTGGSLETWLRVPKGHRTHANNAGLAYCCENMFDELKLVMEGG